MATTKQVTEPAQTADTGTANTVATEPERSYDGQKKVQVYDAKAPGQITDKAKHRVPETWLDGRFPRLKATPSTKKEGK